MNKLVKIFCDVDDFFRVFIPQLEKQLLEDGSQKRRRSSRMTMSEIITILIALHMYHHHDFKNYYKGYIAKFYKSHFPHLLSYTRFLEVMPKAIIALSSDFSILKGDATGIEFIDSTSIKVAISCVFLDTEHLVALLNGVKEQWDGFMDLNFISSPII